MDLRLDASTRLIQKGIGWHLLSPLKRRQMPQRLPGRTGSCDSGISGAAQAEKSPSPLAITRNWMSGWFRQPVLSSERHG